MSAKLALVAAAVLSLAAGAGPQGEILLGGSAPLSVGTAGTDFTRGAAAYFAYANALGGVRGLTIRYEVLDDGGEAGLAAQNVQELVEQEGVFAVFGSFDTAADDYLNAARVPLLFAHSGAGALGAHSSPWTIGYGPTHRAEGGAYARDIRAELPQARIGVLYEDDAFGRELLNGLERGLGAKRSQIVDREGYEPTAVDVQAQVEALRASGADVLCVFASTDLAADAFAGARRLGWRPQIFAAADSTAVPPAGAISAAFLKDPTAPEWADDPGIALYRSILRRYGKGADPKSSETVAGMAAAFTLVDALRRADKSPTRARVVAAAGGMVEANNPFLLPGIAVRTRPASRYPIQQLQLRRFAKGRWQRFGGLLAARP